MDWWSFFVGFLLGAGCASVVLWHLMLHGAKKVVDKIVELGYFMKDGRRYIVKPHNGRLQ